MAYVFINTTQRCGTIPFSVKKLIARKSFCQLKRWWLTEYFMLLYFEPAFHIAKWTFKYNEWFIEWLIYFSMLKIELFPCVWIIYILLLIYDWLDRGNRKVRVKNRCVRSERKWAKFAGGICLIENNSPFIPLFSHYYIYKDSNIIDDISQHEIDTAIHLQWK